MKLERISVASRPAKDDNPRVPRDLCVFIDGTWNENDPLERTNVRKLFDATPEGLAGGRNVLRLYVPGVGRRPLLDVGAEEYEGPVDELLNQFLLKELSGTAAGRAALGGFVGKGTKARIKTAYHFICERYLRRRGDRVFIFGFSRGAYAARSLAGFLGQVGLLLANRLAYVEWAYQIYECSADPGQSVLKDFLQKLTKVRVLTPESEFYLELHFLGVWDTVACLGLPWRRRWEYAPFTEHHQLQVPPGVVSARHALALHELRRDFEPLLWQGGGLGDLQQAWFVGAHADVGGGYRQGETGLSDIALRWMASEARDHGLAVRKEVTWWNTTSKTPSIHHEIRKWFLLAKPNPRKWLALADTLPGHREGHSFHRSAVDYLSAADSIAYEFWRPGVNERLRQVDAQALRVAVRVALHPPGASASQGAGAASDEPVEQTADATGWWESVTAGEVRESLDTMRNFLEGSGEAGPATVESFARSLALRQLLYDSNAVSAAVSIASGSMPGAALDTLQAVRDVENWTKRGRRIEQGFVRCLILLQTRKPAGAEIAVKSFGKEVHNMAWDAVAARARVGTDGPVVGPSKAEFARSNARAARNLDRNGDPHPD